MTFRTSVVSSLKQIKVHRKILIRVTCVLVRNYFRERIIIVNIKKS